MFPGRGDSGAEEVFRGSPQGRGPDPGPRHRPAEIRAQEEVSALRGQDLSRVGGARVRYVTHAALQAELMW